MANSKQEMKFWPILNGHGNIDCYLYLGVSIILTVLLSGCAGKINTIKNMDKQVEYKKAVIISAENSQYIQFNFGIIVPGGYVPPTDKPAIEHKVIGNTDEIIKKELEKYGIHAEIVEKGEIPDDFDLLVKYSDTWRWDFKNILDKLEIVFISPEGMEIAKSTYNINTFKEFHDFPTPEKEVPKMIKELLGKY